MKYLFIASALFVGNFLYQALFAPEPGYGVAFERSYFQAAALFVVWVMDTFPDW